MNTAPTTPPPGLYRRCDLCDEPGTRGREPEGTVRCEAHDTAAPTVRPDKGPCGRIHLTGFPCPTCAAPQWVPWPTHAGWWWLYPDGAEGPVQQLVFADAHLDYWDGDDFCSLDDGVRGDRFLDARLTPPAPPESR